MGRSEPGLQEEAEIGQQLTDRRSLTPNSFDFKLGCANRTGSCKRQCDVCWSPGKPKQIVVQQAPDLVGFGLQQAAVRPTNRVKSRSACSCCCLHQAHKHGHKRCSCASQGRTTSPAAQRGANVSLLVEPFSRHFWLGQVCGLCMVLFHAALLLQTCNAQTRLACIHRVLPPACQPFAPYCARIFDRGEAAHGLHDLPP